MARYRQPDSDQSRMVVLNFVELFPDDHAIPRLLATVRKLDLSGFDSSYTNDSGRGGRPAMPPDRMLALIIYSLLYGNISMRNLERDLGQRADLMYLSGGLPVDHSTIGKFRARHAEAIRELFSQTVFLGIETGLIDLETVCIDSSKIEASANRRDIGTREDFERRYAHIDEVCRQRYAEWGQSEDADRQASLRRDIERLNRRKEKLAAGLEFLKERSDRKRVHLTDPDADWHKDGSNRFIVGYSAQNAVDAKSRMIVHQAVVTEQADSNCTVPMVQTVAELKRSALPHETAQTRYVMDCGYASESNLQELENFDLYLPDRKYASDKLGGKTIPEKRKQKRERAKVQTDAAPRFRYDAGKDSFTCPTGETLTFRRERKLKGVSYRQYRKSGCGSCAIRERCAGPGYREKELWIQSSTDRIDGLEKIVPYRGRGGPRTMLSPGGQLTKAMRTKLDTPENRAVYGQRFHVSEGVFAAMKEIRNGWRFLRRGLARVQVEWAERSIAHNIARLIQFTRISPATK